MKELEKDLEKVVGGVFEIGTGANGEGFLKFDGTDPSDQQEFVSFLSFVISDMRFNRSSLCLMLPGDSSEIDPIMLSYDMQSDLKKYLRKSMGFRLKDRKTGKVLTAEELQKIRKSS